MMEEEDQEMEWTWMEGMNMDSERWNGMERRKMEEWNGLLPTNKSHFIVRIDDVKYYDVKHPTTSFVYHNAMKQGAALTTTYTQNVGKNFNIAVEYMGLRSQGLYRRSLASSNNIYFFFAF